MDGAKCPDFKHATLRNGHVSITVLLNFKDMEGAMQNCASKQLHFHVNDQIQCVPLSLLAVSDEQLAFDGKLIRHSLNIGHEIDENREQVVFNQRCTEKSYWLNAGICLLTKPDLIQSRRPRQNALLKVVFGMSTTKFAE